MYRTSRFVEKFKFIKCTISWKFNGKLCTLDVQKFRIRGKFLIHWIYEIMKINWKIFYIRWTDFPDSWKKLNSLNVWSQENSMENYVHLMYKTSGFVEKFEFIECKMSWKFDGKLCTFDLQNVWIHGKIWIH